MRTHMIVAARREWARRTAVRAALVTAWRTVNHVCGKRLAPFLPELIPTMERHGHLSLFDRTRARLPMQSTATADRIFRLRTSHLKSASDSLIG